MFIKLGIIAGILILGGMIFFNESDSLFLTTSASEANSLKNDVSDFGSKASDSVEEKIDGSIDKIIDKTDTISNEINDKGNKITSKISEVKESSQKIISEEISNFNPIESVKNIFTDNSNPQSPISYETLSLTTRQQSDGNIILQYFDSSGKTNSVNVVIRTTENEIFSGTYFSSMFETTVNHTIGIPYYVDMIIDHQDYGLVSSSVFNPGDSSDLNINGVFTQK